MITIRKKRRTFLPKDLEIKSWKDVKPYADDLLQRPLDSLKTFRSYLRDLDEFQVVIEEKSKRLIIDYNMNLQDREKKKRLADFQTKIEGKNLAFWGKSNKRILSSPYKNKMKDPGFSNFLRALQTEADIYHSQNGVLCAKDRDLSYSYNKIIARISPCVQEKKLSAAEAENFYYSPDRLLRQTAWEAIQVGYGEKGRVIDTLFDKLVKVRHKMAVNAGFPNYGELAFKEMGRFDYTAQDCKNFHQAIKEAILPFAKNQNKLHKQAGRFSKLRAWDKWFDPAYPNTIQAFENNDELLSKLPTLFYNYSVDFGDIVAHHRDKGMYQLEAHKNKVPWASSTYLPESRLSHIINSGVQRVDDMAIAVHESTHAIHAHYCNALKLDFYKSPPNEVSELFPLAMELISQDGWGMFIKNKKDCTHARRQLMTDKVTCLLTLCQMDSFQHHVYENPEMTPRQRGNLWGKLDEEYQTGIDWSGHEGKRKKIWHQYAHFFESPFYCIEYVMAQLGAFQILGNYQKDPYKTIKQLKNAMMLGNSKSVPEIYKAAGANFDFSKERVEKTIQFAIDEIEILHRCEKSGRDPATIIRRADSYAAMKQPPLVA